MKITLISCLVFLIAIEFAGALQCWNCIHADPYSPCDKKNGSAVTTCDGPVDDGDICQINLLKDGTLIRGCGWNATLGFITSTPGEIVYLCDTDLCNSIDLCHPNFTLASDQPTPTSNPNPRSSSKNEDQKSPQFRTLFKNDKNFGKNKNQIKPPNMCYNCTDCAQIDDNSTMANCTGPMASCGMSWTNEGSVNRTCIVRTGSGNWGRMSGRKGEASTMAPSEQLTIMDSDLGMFSYQCQGDKCNNIDLACYRMLNGAVGLTSSVIFISFMAIFIFNF